MMLHALGSLVRVLGGTAGLNRGLRLNGREGAAANVLVLGFGEDLLSAWTFV